MSSEVTPLKIDSRGRVTIPQRIREKLGVKEGDVLFVAKSDKGVLVFYTVGEFVRSARKVEDLTEQKEEKR